MLVVAEVKQAEGDSLSDQDAVEMGRRQVSLKGRMAIGTRI